jgi:hypothetical protein
VTAMSKLRFIEIDSRRYLWRDILELRREQRRAHAAAQQLAVFDLKQDCRESSSRTPAGRYVEPSPFDGAG